MSKTTLILSFILGGLGAFLLNIEHEKIYIENSPHPPRFFVKKNETDLNIRAECDFIHKNFNTYMLFLENPNALDIKGFMEILLQDKNRSAYKMRSQISELWGKKEGAIAIQEFDELALKYNIPIYIKKTIQEDIVKGWMQKNPEEVAAAYLSDKSAFSHPDFLPNLLEVWSYYDKTKALNMFSKLDAEEQKKGISGIIESVFSHKKSKDINHFLNLLSSQNITPQSPESFQLAEKLLEINDTTLSAITDTALKESLQAEQRSLLKVNELFKAYEQSKSIPTHLSKNEQELFIKKVLGDTSNPNDLNEKLISLSQIETISVSANLLNKSVSKLYEVLPFENIHDFLGSIQNPDLRHHFIESYHWGKRSGKRFDSNEQALRLADLIQDPVKKDRYLLNVHKKFGWDD